MKACVQILKQRDEFSLRALFDILGFIRKCLELHVSMFHVTIHYTL